MKRFLLLLTVLATAWGFGTSPDQSAYDKAKSVVGESYRTHVMSMYGKGSDKVIDTWYINFFDPESPTKAKVVLIQNGRVERSYASQAKAPYDDNLSFDPALGKVSVDAALRTARAYADKNQITYNGTHVLLRRTEVGKAPIWRVELRQDGQTRGFVYANAEDGSFANYDKPSEVKSGPSGGTTSGAEEFANDVEKTFKGIGADLEEFFTGERTVDK